MIYCFLPGIQTDAIVETRDCATHCRLLTPLAMESVECCMTESETATESDSEFEYAPDDRSDEVSVCMIACVHCSCA